MHHLSRDKQSIEQMLMETVHTLDSRRAAQVLDFARWLQTQSETDEDQAEEEAWETAYMQNKDEFRAMAQQALDDLDAGETLEMTIENGVILPR